MHGDVLQKRKSKILRGTRESECTIEEISEQRVVFENTREVMFNLKFLFQEFVQCFPVELFKYQLIGKKKPEKIRASTGFEPVTPAIPVQCSTN